MFANMKKDVTDTSNLGLTVGHVYTGTGYVLKKKKKKIQMKELGTKFYTHVLNQSRVI